MEFLKTFRRVASIRLFAAGSLLALLFAFAAGCSDAPLDADTALTTLSEQRWRDSLARVAEEMRVLDSIKQAQGKRFQDSLGAAEERRYADSVRYADSLRKEEERRYADSVHYADSLARCKPVEARGILYFQAQSGLRPSVDLVFEHPPTLEIIGNHPSGVMMVKLDLNARIDAQIVQIDPYYQCYDAPSLIDLHVYIGIENGKGVQSLEHDPVLGDQGSGLGVIYRLPYSGLVGTWMATDGASNTGTFHVEAIDLDKRTMSASLEATFHDPHYLSIKRIRFTFKY